MVTPKYTWVLRVVHAAPLHNTEDVLETLLRTRGISQDHAPTFLSPHLDDDLHDPLLLPDAEAAVARILRARDTHERIAVFGDYDVDGVTASSVLADAFSRLSMEHRIALPHREQDGYGITLSAVRQLVPPATLLITVDNGTNAHDAIAEARRRGADVIVIDHHMVQEPLPEHALIVNPARGGHRYPFSQLSAAGLAYKVARALFRATGRAGEERFLLDLVALGTLADRVPLTDENRQLVRRGLHVLRDGRRPGIVALADRARMILSRCTAQDVAFRLAPRLNAAGRLQHADLAYQLLTTTDPAEAGALADTLERLNTERKRLTDSATRDIQETLVRALPLPDVIFLAGSWPVGVLGILAGKIAEECGRPAVVVNCGAESCVGSLRGVGTVNVVELLVPIASILTKYGGHADAAGMSFPRPALPEVTGYFSSMKLPDHAARPGELAVDCHLNPTAVTVDLTRHLDALEPHGEGNEKPAFLLSDLRMEEHRGVGTDGVHRRFVFSTAMRGVLSGIAFRWGDRVLPERREPIDVVVELERSSFRSEEKVDVLIRDMRTHERVGAQVTPV